MPVIPRAKALPPSETALMQSIRDALSRMGDVVLFRNNVGMLKDARGVPVRYGLATGSADLIGSLRVTMPACGEGCTVARALAIEVKVPGKHPTQEQIAWLDAMRAQGWLVGVATSVEEAAEIVEKGRRWEL